MRLAVLAWRYLWARPLVSGLNLALMTMGLAAMAFVVLVSEQMEAGLRRDLAGIDLVVGAKGSPMQIMLSGVFHLDVPTGNIPVAAIQALRDHPLVAAVVPMSLGDAVKGHRIVGTTPDYAALYGAALAQGRWWSPQAQPLEVVLGASAARDLGLRLGDRFVGTHGLAGEGEVHGDSPYVVVGVMAPTHSVLDRLVLAATEAVWAVHEQATATDAKDLAILAEEREVTLLLVKYRSPLAAASLPRWVNAQDGLQAASPALETARLLRMVGVGVDVLKGFGGVLLLAAGLSVFVALFHAVREREADLAMMRMLGAPPWRLAMLVGFEALWLALLATVSGLVLAHGMAEGVGRLLAAEQSVTIRGGVWVTAQAWLPLWAFGLALAASALPVWRAYRLDVGPMLQAR